MARLTSERVNGIKSGFWSSVKKDELIQRLGPIERDISHITAEICNKYCKYPGALRHEDQLMKRCEKCPVKKLVEMVEGKE